MARPRISCLMAFLRMSYANCSALEIWTTICDILEVSFNVKEESYYVRKNNYENLAMLTNKNVNKVTLICMYLWSKSTP
jgi:hypothetical protein